MSYRGRNKIYAELDEEGYVPSRDRPTGTMIATTACRWLFVFVLMGMMSTGFAQIFGVFRVIEKVKRDVVTMRAEKTAWLQSPTCLAYEGKLSEDEREKYDKAHLIDPKYCNDALAVLEESQFSQQATAFFSHYAFCEPGKCYSMVRDSIISTSMYGIMMGLPTAVIVVALLWATGSFRASETEVERLQRQLLIEKRFAIAAAPAYPSPSYDHFYTQQREKVKEL